MKSKADLALDDSTALIRCAAELVDTAEGLVEEAFNHLNRAPGGSFANRLRLTKAVQAYREALQNATIESDAIERRFPGRITASPRPLVQLRCT